MRESALGPESGINNLLPEILESRPILPVGSIGLPQPSVDATPKQPGYAWERLPRWLYQIKETFEGTSTPVVCVDLCSSVPLYGQLLRAQQFLRDGRHAKRLVNESLGDGLIHANKNRWNTELKPIASAFAKNKTAKSLLTSIVHEALYTITLEEFGESGISVDDRLFKSRLLELMTTRREIIISDKDPDSIESSWDLKFEHEDAGGTYFDLLRTPCIPTSLAKEASALLVATQSIDTESTEHVGLVNEESYASSIIYSSIKRMAADVSKHKGLPTDEQVIEFMDLQATHFTKLVVGNQKHRPSRYISLDSAPVDQIIQSSLVNTPESTQSLNMFSHALDSLGDPNQHITQNIFDDLPFPDDSLTLITCFDGWPFHFTTNDESHEDIGAVILDRLLHFYKKLAPGGKIVIFPFSVQAENHSESKYYETVLNKTIVEFAKIVLHGVLRQTTPVEVLQLWMSNSDRITAEEHSPIFNTSSEDLTTLIINKPQHTPARGRT